MPMIPTPQKGEAGDTPALLPANGRSHRRRVRWDADPPADNDRRKTGRRRTTPLLYVTDGENIVVLASNGGRPRHPHWWLNLEENPEAALQVRQQERWVRAEEAIGEERERLRRPPRDIPQVRRVSEGYHAKDPGGGSAALRVGRALESGNSGACSGRWRSWRAASGSRRRAGRLRRRASRSS
jgi:deazaflavin-dependent oxidoreductase (nitroreductase family)